MNTVNMNVYLANLSVWLVKLHNLHWNVEGHAFVQVHQYTESVYDRVFEQFDEVAEAQKMQGVMPPSTLAEYMKLASLKEEATRKFSVSEVIEIVVADIKAMRELAMKVRQDAIDADAFAVQGMFEGFVAAYDKDLWFLRAMQTECCCTCEA